MSSSASISNDPTPRAGQRAVFLSYASEDTEPARRLCEALRAKGIEVWFDQSELRGGDAWDAAIRRQIKELLALYSGHLPQLSLSGGGLFPP